MKSSSEFTPSEIHERTFQPDVPGRFELDLPYPTAQDGEADAEQEKLLAAAFESGREQGLATASARCEPALAALGAAAAELSTQKHDYLHAQRHLLVELAIEIAEHIIGRSVVANPEMIIARIEEAITLAGDTRPSSIELNPDDQALITEAHDAATFGEHIQLVANADLARGEFVLTSGRTTIDARFASLLEGVREALDHVDSAPESGADVIERTSA